MISALLLTAAAASKWLIASKILVTVGTGLTLAGPVLDKLTDKD